MTAPGSWLRRLSLVLAFAVLVLGVLTARAVLEGQAELERSKAAFDQGKLSDAVLHARRAAVAYAPGAPHVALAYDRLRTIARGSEAAGDPQTARLAWGAIRSAAIETRHVFSPEEALREEADRQLARLAAEARPATATRTPRRPVDSAAAGPHPLWAALLALGFGLLLAGLAFVSLRGVERDGKIRLRPLLVGLAVSLLGAACWTMSLYWA